MTKNSYNAIVKNGVWVTKDGRVLEISKMSVDHIQKCIGVLEEGRAMVVGKGEDLSQYNLTDAYIEMFQVELAKRGVA